jgi:hypothetical protein
LTEGSSDESETKASLFCTQTNAWRKEYERGIAVKPLTRQSHRCAIRRWVMQTACARRRASSKPQIDDCTSARLPSSSTRPRRVGLSNRIASGAACAVTFRDMAVRLTRRQHDYNFAARASRWTRGAATTKWLRLGRAKTTSLCDRPLRLAPASPIAPPTA